MTNEPSSIADQAARNFALDFYGDWPGDDVAAVRFQQAIAEATAELRQENAVIRQANADANKLIEAAANEATKLNDQWRTKWEASCETLGNAIEREHAKDARISELEATVKALREIAKNPSYE